MVSALRASIIDNDEAAVADILDFSSERRLIIHVDVRTVEFLNRMDSYNMIRRLLRAFVQFRRPGVQIAKSSQFANFGEDGVSDASGNSHDVNMKERHLRLSDFIHCSYGWINIEADAETGMVSIDTVKAKQKSIALLIEL